MWTFQEILLAANPVVVCGEDHISWFYFSFNLLFLYFSGVASQGHGPKLSSLSAWVKLILSRDRILASNNTNATSGASSTKRAQQAGDDTDSTPLQKYVAFAQSTLRTYKNLVGFVIEKVKIAIGLVSLGFCIYTVAAWFPDSGPKDAVRSGMQLSMIKMETTRAESTQLALPSTVIGPSPSTASVSGTRLNITVMDVTSTIVNPLEVGKTAKMPSTASTMRSTTSSVANSCQFICARHPNTPSCFRSCSATSAAMPLVNTTSSPDGVMLDNMPTLSYLVLQWSVIGALFTSLLCAFGLLFIFLFRGESLVLATRSDTITVDLIDGLCRRKAKHPHDKAFALRSVLQRLTVIELPPPDYTRPLDKTYEELNLVLFRAMGCNQLLFVASLSSLSGFPCWMADWSEEIDPFWLEQSFSRFCESNERRAGDCPSSKVILGINNSLVLRARFICPIQTCFAFHETHDTSHLHEREIHLKNLDVGLEIFRRSHLVQKDMAALYRNLENLFVLGAPTCPREEVQHWLSFLQSNFNNSTELAFQVLTQNLRILEIQTSICNEFVRGKRQLFWSASDRHTWRTSVRISRPAGYYYNYIFGICRIDCQIGDMLLSIPGMSMPLIVRVLKVADTTSGAKISGRLVSPAAVRGEMGHERKVWAGDYREFRFTKEIELHLR